MVLKFKFSKERVGEHIVFRPKIPVKLKGEKDFVFADGIIDTGTDISVIPNSIADIIGIAFKDGPDMLTMENPYRMRYGKIDLEVVAKEQRNTIKIASLPIASPVVEGSEPWLVDDVIIGIAGFFDNLEITFNKQQNRILIKQK